MWLCDFVSIDGEWDGMLVARTYMLDALSWELGSSVWNTVSGVAIPDAREPPSRFLSRKFILPC